MACIGSLRPVRFALLPSRCGIGRWNSQSCGGILVFMSDVTRILSQIEQGDPTAAEQLLPLVYKELRKLAAAKLAQEKPGQTLQATALVHEAYLRLVDGERVQPWDNAGPLLCGGGRGHAADSGRGPGGNDDPSMAATGSVSTWTVPAWWNILRRISSWHWTKH